MKQFSTLLTGLSISLFIIRRSQKKKIESIF